MARADVHSRSPVTAAGGTCPNSRSASPAPYWTDTIPADHGGGQHELGPARSWLELRK